MESSIDGILGEEKVGYRRGFPPSEVMYSLSVQGGVMLRPAPAYRKRYNDAGPRHVKIQ